MTAELELMFSENFYFTVTEKKWVSEKLSELELLEISLSEILSEISITQNKKENAAKFIVKLQEIFSPVQVKFNEKISEIKKRVKYPNVSINIPQNLEGESIEVLLKLKNGKQAKELIEFLNSKKEHFENLGTLFQGGGIEF